MPTRHVTDPGPSMPVTRQTLATVARTAGFVLLGLVATAVLGVGLLYVTRDIQSILYRVLYLSIGPTDATRLAMITHFTVVAILALTLPALAVLALLGEPLPSARAVKRGVGLGAGLVFVFALTTRLGVVPYLSGLAILALLLFGIPLLLYHQYEIDSPAVPTLGGGVPVVILLFLLLGFGMGWGWGYVMIAETAPTSTVNGATAADFDTVPQIEADLFRENACSGLAGGGEQCILSLRGYEHELAATRFMAEHGVRCPYVNAPAGTSAEAGSFIAEHNDTYYRVTCSPHGD